MHRKNQRERRKKEGWDKAGKGKEEKEVSQIRGEVKRCEKG